MPHVYKRTTDIKMRFGILTVSDTCFKQDNVDKSGPKIKSLIKAKYTESIVIYEDIVPDELEKIKEKLIEWSDDMCDVVFTTGGTGIADRDVTPEATKAVIDKEVPGISFVMMSKSLASTPFAMLSRAISGIRKKTLIINFPGSVKAVTENFEAVSDILPHAISLLQNKFEDIQKIHSRLVNLPPIQPKLENIPAPLPVTLPTALHPIFPALNLAPSNVFINTVTNRPRASPYEMVSVDNALGIITMNCSRTSDTEVLPIVNVMGRVLAEDIRSRDALPPFAASIKDGYAVISSDGAGLRQVVDVKAAGDNPLAQILQSGQCIRISTGAPVPPGADSVVQVEDTELVKSTGDSTKELEINIKVVPKPGQDIRPIGSDIPAHSIVLQKGNVLNAAEVGVLAAVGQTQAKVFKPRAQKRSNLSAECRDLVKNVIFYFDQQKNAGGFLFPIERPTEAAAAAAGIARSTVVKIRREIKDESSIIEPNVDITEYSEIEYIDDDDRITTSGSPNKKSKKRIKKPGEVKLKRIRKQKFKPKGEKIGLNSSKIKITKDDIAGMKTHGSTVIEIQGKNNLGAVKRTAPNLENSIVKKNRVSKKNKEIIVDDNLDEQIKIITNELVDSTTHIDKPRKSLPVKRIILDGKKNEILSESLSNLTKTYSGRPMIKRIRIEARKNAFLSENTAKLAAAAGVDLKTIKLIKKEVLNDSLTKPITVSNKDSPKIKIIKKSPPNPIKKPTSFKIITREEYAAMQSKNQKNINVLHNQIIRRSTFSPNESNSLQVGTIETSETTVLSPILKSALSNNEVVITMKDIENATICTTEETVLDECLNETVLVYETTE